MIMQEKLTPGM